MTIFVAPVSVAIPHAGVLCAFLLLTIISLKIMTLHQDSKLLMRLNKSLSIGLYPMAMIFVLLLVEWTAL